MDEILTLGLEIGSPGDGGSTSALLLILMLLYLLLLLLLLHLLLHLLFLLLNKHLLCQILTRDERPITLENTWMLMAMERARLPWYLLEAPSLQNPWLLEGTWVQVTTQWERRSRPKRRLLHNLALLLKSHETVLHLSRGGVGDLARRWLRVDQEACRSCRHRW